MVFMNLQFRQYSVRTASPFSICHQSGLEDTLPRWFVLTMARFHGSQVSAGCWLKVTWDCWLGTLFLYM